MLLLIITYQMLIVIQLLLVIVLSRSISQANLHRLRKTPSFNFTYYYYHQYPLPQAFEAVIGFSKASDNFTQLLLQLQQFSQQVRAEAVKYNATVVSNQIDKFANRVQIFMKETVQLDAIVEVHVTDQQQLVSFIDAAAKIENAKVLQVQRIRLPKLDLSIEDAKAKVAATIKSEQVCNKYFGMSFKEIVLFDKVVANETNKTNNETERFVGDFLEAIDKIAELENEGHDEDDQAFFKCQITCYNPNYTPNKHRNDSPKPQLKKKIDSKHAEKITKAKLPNKPVQKPIKKEKVAGTKGSKGKKQKQQQL